jgi:hypothetical protein
LTTSPLRLLAFAFLLAALLLAALLPRTAAALELYTFVERDCRATTGLIVNLTEEAVHLLSVQGRFAEVPRPQVKHILVYNTLDNPIARVELSPPLRELVREVHLGDGKDGGEAREGGEPSFTGWPIRFFEELIVFYSLAGKTHIVDIDRIRKIRRPEGLAEQVDIPNASETVFGLGRNLPECPQPPPGPGTVVQPTRMISDQIKVVRFLRVYREGFGRLNRFQSRAAFYARPYLFEQRTRLGLVVVHEKFQEELPAQFPFYFQWSSGRPFNSQAFFTIGSRPVELLPNVEPVFMLRSDVKAHFFSASFVGNPRALSQGDGFMIEERFGFEGFFSQRGAGAVLVLPSFNQLALTALDFGRYSFAGGFYYPVFGIQGNGIFREIFATEAAPIVRFVRTGPETQFRALASQIDVSSADPSDDDIRLVLAQEMVSPGALSPVSLGLLGSLERFSLRADFYRVGMDFNITKELLLGVDEVVLRGTYAEVLGGEPFDLRFEHAITALRYRHTFGVQAGLTGYLNYFRRTYETRTGSGGREREEERFSLAVAIEFFL